MTKEKHITDGPNVIQAVFFVVSVFFCFVFKKTEVNLMFKEEMYYVAVVSNRS